MERAILEAVARADLILCWVWRVAELPIGLGFAFMVIHLIDVIIRAVCK